MLRYSPINSHLQVCLHVTLTALLLNGELQETRILLQSSDSDLCVQCWLCCVKTSTLNGFYPTKKFGKYFRSSIILFSFSKLFTRVTRVVANYYSKIAVANTQDYTQTATSSNSVHVEYLDQTWCLCEELGIQILCRENTLLYMHTGLVSPPTFSNYNVAITYPQCLC